MPLNVQILSSFRPKSNICASCDASYIGSTKRSLHCRVEQHLGRSYRTGVWLTRPDPSPIRNHVVGCNTTFSINNFKIIGQGDTLLDLRLLESLHILKSKPDLNDNTSAVQLNVVVWTELSLLCVMTVYECLPLTVYECLPVCAWIFLCFYFVFIVNLNSFILNLIFKFVRVTVLLMMRLAL